MFEQKLIKLGNEIAKFASDHERAILGPYGSSVLVLITIVAHHYDANRDNSCPRVLHLRLVSHTFDLWITEPASVAEMIVTSVGTRSWSAFEKNDFLDRRTAVRKRKCRLHIIDKFTRDIIVVRGDEEDAVYIDFILGVPVGCPELAALSASIAKGLGILLLTFFEGVVQQAVVQTEKLET